MWVIAIFAFFAGLILVIVAPIGKAKNNRCTATTRGKMVKTYETESNDVIRTNYVYSYSVDGVKYEIDSTSAGDGGGAVGFSCTIWYNPKIPERHSHFVMRIRYLQYFLLLA